MSRRKQAFNNREPKPRMASEDYLRLRKKEYGDIGDDFPTSQHLKGYSAVAGHREYKQAQERSTKAGNAYRAEESRSANYVTRQPASEQQYMQMRPVAIHQETTRNSDPWLVPSLTLRLRKSHCHPEPRLWYANIFESCSG